MENSRKDSSSQRGRNSRKSSSSQRGRNSRKNSSSQRGRNSRKSSDIFNFPFSILNLSVQFMLTAWN